MIHTILKWVYLVVIQLWITVYAFAVKNQFPNHRNIIIFSWYFTMIGIGIWFLVYHGEEIKEKS